MTSMPASRSARAMTFAPRSWPSRPGLAMSTRSFFVGAEDGAHGVADFAERGIGFYRVVYVRHQVFVAQAPVGGWGRSRRPVVGLGGLAQREQGALDLGVGAV